MRRDSRRPHRVARFMLAVLLLGRSPGLAAQEDIRDIRLPQRPTTAWVWTALLGGACSIALIAVIVGRRRRGAQPAAATPFETALLRLEAARTLMRPATADEFSVAVSGILRDYVEQAFHVTATQRTTEEFLRDLVHSSNAVLAGQRAQLGEFLQHCDLAKFAGVPLSLQDMQSLYGSARAFVDQTAGQSHDPLPAA